MGGEERRFIEEAFATNYIAPLGPMVDAFEREFAERVGFRHTLALSSGTAAMHLALRELGVGPGDEVLASTLTFIAGVTPAVQLGAAPVFIDSDRATWNMDPNLLAEELAACAKKGKLPKAVVPTDLYGQCADVDRIRAACDPHGVPVVVDSAEAVGASYKGRHAGAGGRAAVYSFNGNKIITTSGGGMLASDDAKLIEHTRFLSTQARDPAPHYEHSEIGYNYRMSSIVAAIGCGQLRVLDQRVEKRRWIFEQYVRLLGNLPGIEFMPEAAYGRSNRWLTVALITAEAFGADPAAVRRALEAENIETRPVWKPMHQQPVFRGCRLRGGAVAEDLFQRGLCLPSGTALEQEDLERIAGLIRKSRG
ncbi:MAG: aminotransferase class I/II-fold pyridoxal phosphate-dependent enzyme [Verrucomicrobiota bacterium]|nr:aminotransferase class I/II-fold pyridoxal phosphate-dependent enzyme [Verrucomicrobiota bacterium]